MTRVDVIDFCSLVLLSLYAHRLLTRLVFSTGYRHRSRIIQNHQIIRFAVSSGFFFWIPFSPTLHNKTTFAAHYTISISYLVVKEALEWLRNKQGTVKHSYDRINDQEKAEIQLEFQDELSVDEVLNEQVPSELAANPQTTENHSPSAITMYNQPTEISDDQLYVNQLDH